MYNDGLDQGAERAWALLGRIEETLPALPGFRSLSIFGSLAEGRADQYSDVDVIVTTDDLPEARTQVLGLLEQIGAIEFCWAINLRPDEWNPMIVFRKEGYYQRLELGLADSAAVDRTTPAEQTVLLCDRPAAPAAILGGTEAYIPEHGSIGHFLLGNFVGCVRYVKSLKRGQTMTAYRFAAAAAEWRLALRYARLRGNPHFRTKLSTEDYKKLDGSLTPENRDQLLSSFDFSSVIAMDSAVITAMDGMLEDGLHLAAALGEAIPTEVFRRMREFVEEELRS